MGDFFRHPQALVESESVGARTRIWAWAHIMEGARVGADCNVGEHCFIEKGAVVGDRVTLKNGVAVWEGVTIEDDVFLGPNAVLTNDPRPRSGAEGFVPVPTLLRQGCSVGANASILPGVTIGRYALIGAGAVVTGDVPDHALIIGNPGRQQGHVCVCGLDLELEADRARCRCGRGFVLERGSITELS